MWKEKLLAVSLFGWANKKAKKWNFRNGEAEAGRVCVCAVRPCVCCVLCELWKNKKQKTKNKKQKTKNKKQKTKNKKQKTENRRENDSFLYGFGIRTYVCFFSEKEKEMSGFIRIPEVRYDPETREIRLCVQ